MKHAPLKITFAAIALSAGMAMTSEDVHAQPGFDPYIFADEDYAVYHAEQMEKAEKRVAALEAIKAVIVDPSKGPKDIKAALGDVRFNHFDKGDAKHLYKARQKILGSQFKAATESQAIEIMHEMHALDNKENNSLMLAGFGAMACLGSLFTAIDYATRLNRRREEKPSAPKP